MPESSPLTKKRSIEAALEGHVMRLLGDRVPSAHRAAFESWLNATVRSRLEKRGALTKADMADLEQSAEAALEKLLASATRKQVQIQVQPASAAHSRPESGAGAQQKAAARQGGDETPTRREAPAVEVSSPSSSPSRDLFSPSKNSGANGLTAFSLVDAATGKPLPELEILKIVRRKAELKTALAKQLAEHQAADVRSTLLHQSYVAAEDEMVRRANGVDERRKEEQRRKVAEDAALTRQQLAERAAAKAAEEAKQKAEDEATLARMIAHYEADMEKLRERQKREKDALMASKRENDEQRRVRQEAEARATEEEIRRQTEYAQKVIAAEKAHKNKYKHIAEKQDLLASLLLDATAEHREKMDSFYRIQEEKAKVQAKQDALDTERRKENKQKSIMETAEVVRMQMKEKEAEREQLKREDQVAGAQARAEAEAAAEMRRKEKERRQKGKSEFMEVLGQQLTQKMQLQNAGPEPKYKPYADGKGTSLVLNTTSSDMDTEALFKVSLKHSHAGATNDALKRGNRSDEIAPLLGFGAPFLTKIEEMSKLADVPVPDPNDAIALMQPKLAFGGTQPSNLVIRASHKK